MTDSATKKPIRVTTHETAGSFIELSRDQRDQVHKLLEANQVRFWVDHHWISVDRSPYMGVIYLARGTDPDRVQALLDAVP